MATIARPPLLRLTAVQALILLLLAVAVLPFGRVYTVSVLAGGGIQIAASTYFAWKAFQYQGARQLAKTVQSMYRGETGKVLLTAALFALAFVFLRPVNMATLVAAYVALALSHAYVTAKLLQHHRY
jgi:ATP synthase protein I